MKKRNKILLFIILSALFPVIMVIRIAFTMITDNATVSYKPLPEYDSLFTNIAQPRLKIVVTTKSNTRPPTSTYTYDGRFKVFVMKALLNNDFDENSIANYKRESSSHSLDAVYAGVSNYHMEMDMKSGKTTLVSKVYFKFSGDSITLTKKYKDLYCYFFKFKTFSISYDDQPYDIIAVANDSTIPASVAFKRAGRSLYIIIMTVNKGEESMPADLLKNILN